MKKILGWVALLAGTSMLSLRAGLSLQTVLSLCGAMSALAGVTYSLPRLWAAARWTARAVVALDTFARMLPQILALDGRVRAIEERLTAIDTSGRIADCRLPIAD